MLGRSGMRPSTPPLQIPGAFPLDSPDPSTPSPTDLDSRESNEDRPVQLTCKFVCKGSAADVWLCHGSDAEGPNTSQIHAGDMTAIKKIMRVVPGSFKNTARSRGEDILLRLRKNFAGKFEMWRSLNHPNISQIYRVLPDELTLYQEYCSSGDLREHVKKGLPEADYICITTDILSGLSYLHTYDPPITHGCINPGKIYIAGQTAKLGEFGLSQLVAKIPHLVPSIFVTGTTRWMSPEYFDGSQPGVLTTQGDVWSFGCTLLEIITGCIPYHQIKYDTQVLVQILDGVKPGNPKSEQYTYEKGPSRAYIELAQHLITQCWSSVGERPSSQMLLEKFKQLKIEATPSEQTDTLNPPPAPTEAPTSSESGISSQSKFEGWANLRGLFETLNQASTDGLAPVKRVIEELIELIEVYEDAARDQKEYDDLRVQLECVFDDLRHHLSPPPVATASIDVCQSIQMEIDLVKAQQARPKERKKEIDSGSYQVLECYRRIQDHLQQLVRNASDSTSKIFNQPTKGNCLQKLAPSLWACYNSEKALELKRGPCTEGTRLSVLAQMYQWTTSQDAGSVYWVNGMAGTGKTTIAYSLCERLDTVPNQTLGASFFCSRLLPECRDVGQIIPSIAYQLACRSRPFRLALCRVIEENPDVHARLPQLQFDSLLAQPLSDIKVREAFPGGVVVVIDALDECDDAKSTRQILEVLLTKSKNLPIKFVVSSRPEPAIRDQMKENGTWAGAGVVLHELDSVQVRGDIRTYLQAELARIKPSQSEVDRLAVRAGVLFIYAATAIRYILGDEFGQDHRERLNMVLAEPDQVKNPLTNDIDNLYTTVLQAAFDNPGITKKEREDMKLILGTVICARNPLTVDALNNLLRLGNVRRVQVALRPFWSVLHVMGPNMTVGTLHASMADYLLDSSRSGAWHCDAAAQHHLLAQRCFECIENTKTQFNICRLESSYLIDDEVVDLDERVHKYIPIELRYACQHWSSHLYTPNSHKAANLVPLLLQFLTERLLLWMEVRNLTKSMPAALGDLMAAKRWATRYDTTHDTIDLLGDAWRFTSTFVSSPVSQSTPHLYISMLPLLSPYSPIHKHYLNRFRGPIGIEGTAPDRRKGAMLAQWKFNLDIQSTACSPDGTRIAIGGRANDVDRIYLLDASSGDLLLDLSHGDEATIWSIAFSPDSTRLVSGRSDGLISAWNATNGQPVLSPFIAHNDAVQSILFSHDGLHIASASWDKTIRIWDALSGKPVLAPLIGHTDAVACIAISSDDSLLVSGSNDRTIRVWDMQSGNLVMGPITGHEGGISAIALSPDDPHILVSGSADGTIRVWDKQTGRMVLGPLQDQPARINSVSISPDGTEIVSTSIDGARIWNAASGKIVSQLGRFSKGNYTEKWVTYSPDGAHIIFARSDGTICLLDAQSAALESDPLPGHPDPIASIDISPDSQRLVSGSWDRTICVWDLAQGRLILGPLQGHTGWVNMVRFSPNSSRIVSCAADSTICQWDAQSGAVQGKPISVASAGPFGVISATYSPDGALLASLTDEGDISVWSSNNGQFVWQSVTSPNQPNGVHAEFSSDGVIVIAGYNDGSVRACDAQTGRVVFSHQGYGRSDTLSLAFSPDSQHYAQALTEGEISQRNIRTTGQILGAFQGHTENVRSVQYSPDATRLVSGSDDKTVHLWDVETGKSVLEPLRGHTEPVRVVAFSPDGRCVASASDDRVIRVWDVRPQTSTNKDGDSKDVDWVLNKDGWVVSGESRRLFWVPSDLRASLMWPRNTTLVSRGGYMRLNFNQSRIGEAWADCWGSI